jgi:hypothetical protein
VICNEFSKVYSPTGKKESFYDSTRFMECVDTPGVDYEALALRFEDVSALCDSEVQIQIFFVLWCSNEDFKRDPLIQSIIESPAQSPYDVFVIVYTDADRKGDDLHDSKRIVRIIASMQPLEWEEENEGREGEGRR